MSEPVIIGVAQIIIAAIGTVLALWALWLQRREIKRAAEMGALTGLAQVLEQRIARDEATLAGLKESNEQWKGLARRINTELKPQLEKTHLALLLAFKRYGSAINHEEVAQALARTPKFDDQRKAA